jgi:hypothetical protein
MTEFEFLDQNTYNLTPQEYNQALDDLEKLDNESWAKKYDALFSEKTTGWNELRNKYKPLPERLTAAFGTSDSKNPFVQPKALLDDMYEKEFTDVPREKFNESLENMSKYWEDEKRAREYNAGRKSREKEVKNWPLWKNIAASDYAKQRYINEPDKSVFSDEGEWYNKGEDVSDLIYGGAGAVADVIPGYGAFLGPTIRAARDVQHKVTDSPYQKEWSNIGQDVLADAAVNAGVEFMPTALLNRGRRFGKNIGKSDEVFSDFGAEMNFAQRQKANDAAFEYLNKNLDMFADARVAQIRVNAMPESDIKNDMLKLVNSDKYSKREVERYMDAYQKASEEGIDAYKYVKNSNVRPNKNMKTEHLGENTVDFFKSKERLMGLPESKLRTGVAKLSTNYAPAGQTVVKEIDTAKGRGSQPEVDTKLVKDWYKQNYERDWKLGFKPNEKEGDLLWEAYKEWTEGK